MSKRKSVQTSGRAQRARPRKPPPKRTGGRLSALGAGKVPAEVRAQLAAALDWHDAHVDFDGALAGIPSELRGRSPDGLPYSLWQLLEHLRLTQRDILAFCRAPKYVEPKWPDDYWPSSEAPPSPAAWDHSIAAFKHDLEELKRLAIDPTVDLLAKIPRGSGQTYLREIILIIDHNAHHIGQIVMARRLLGAWPA